MPQEIQTPKQEEQAQLSGEELEHLSFVQENFSQILATLVALILNFKVGTLEERVQMCILINMFSGNLINKIHCATNADYANIPLFSHTVSDLSIRMYLDFCALVEAVDDHKRQSEGLPKSSLSSENIKDNELSYLNPLISCRFYSLIIRFLEKGISAEPKLKAELAAFISILQAAKGESEKFLEKGGFVAN